MAGFGFSGGLSGSKSSYSESTTIDPRTRAFWEANYGAAQGTPENYGLLSRGTIDQYMSPYTDAVVDASLSDLDRFRQRALADNKGIANRSGAFTSYDTEALRDGITNEGFFNQAGLLASQLRERGYGQALQVGQQENMNRYQYPLQRQGVLNQAASLVQPDTTTKGKSKKFGWDLGFKAGFGGMQGG